MKYVIIFLCILLNSCTIFYNIDYEYNLSEEDIIKCKAVFNNSIELDNIWICSDKYIKQYGLFGQDCGGLYFPLEDKILISASATTTNIRLQTTLLHELTHRYQYKYNIEVEEEAAYLIMEYPVYLMGYEIEKHFHDITIHNLSEYMDWLPTYLKYRGG